LACRWWAGDLGGIVGLVRAGAAGSGGEIGVNVALDGGLGVAARIVVRPAGCGSVDFAITITAATITAATVTGARVGTDVTVGVTVTITVVGFGVGLDPLLG
jgi:hypothetical protein